jgi:hypothetical protein
VRREHFEHVIAAAANIVGADEFVVIGSQAILGPHPDAPGTLLRSLEVDLFPAAEPDKADLIDGALGDGSPFHRSFGYYGHGVGPETAQAPAGWRERWSASRCRLGCDRGGDPSPGALNRMTWCWPSALPGANATGSSPAMRWQRSSCPWKCCCHVSAACR